MKNFRVLASVRVEFTRGLNVVHGENDAGKTTLMTAIRTAFTVPSKKAGSFLAQLRPHDGSDPEIEVVFERAGTTYTLFKRYGSKRITRLSARDAAGRPVEETTGEDAEARLRGVLGLPVDATNARKNPELGIWPLVWVQQGRGHLEVADDLNDASRDALSERLAALGGDAVPGTGAEALFRAVDDEYQLFFTATGHATGKSDSEYVRAREALRLAEIELNALSERLGEQEHEVDAYAELERRAAASKAAIPELERQCSRAAASLNALKEMREKLATARAEAEAARMRMELCVSRTQERTALRKQIEDGTRAISQAVERFEVQGEALRSRDAERPRLEQDVVAKDAVQLAADRNRKRTRAHHDMLLGAQNAERAGRELAEARALAGHRSGLDARMLLRAVTAAAVARLEKLDRASQKAAMALGAAVPGIKLHALEEVTLEIDGSARRIEAGASECIQVDSELTIRVPGVIEIQIVPRGTDLAELRNEARAARAALASALRDANCGNLEEARARFSEGQRLETEIGATLRALAKTAPAGVESLASGHASQLARVDAAAKFLAELTSPSDPLLPTDLAEASAAAQRADREHEMARDASSAAREALARHEILRGTLDGDARVATEGVRATHERVQELTRALSRMVADYGDDSVLESARLTAMREQGERLSIFESLAAEVSRLDETGVQANAERAEKALRSAHQEQSDLSRELNRLAGRLGAGDLIGFHERRGRAEAAVLLAQDEFDRIAERAAAVKLLRDTMESCRVTARQAFLGPLRREIEPLLHTLFGGSQVDFDDEFGVQRVHRDSHGSDRFLSLGGGSREQLALLVRLGMAKVLAGDGPLPVMLDDSIVFTSSNRFERMATLLTRLARDLQIIVFTCHWDRFRSLGADHVVDLEARKREG